MTHNAPVESTVGVPSRAGKASSSHQTNIPFFRLGIHGGHRVSCIACFIDVREFVPPHLQATSPAVLFLPKYIFDSVEKHRRRRKESSKAVNLKGSEVSLSCNADETHIDRSEGSGVTSTGPPMNLLYNGPAASSSL